MTFLRAVLNRSVVNDMTTQSLRELRTLSLLNSSRPVSKYDKWRRKSLTKAPEPPAVSMVSARLQGSPFGSSKRKNSRLVSEEDREHLRQILEKELEEKEQKAREPAEPAEHNPQPPVSTVSTISAPGFADDLKKPAVSVPPSTPPVSTISTVSTIPGGGNPMKSVEMMETVESDASSVGSLPPLDSFLEDSAVKPEKPKISTVTTFSTIPNASNSMEEGQSSSDEERNASLLEQFEKEMGMSGIPKKDPKMGVAESTGPRTRRTGRRSGAPPRFPPTLRIPRKTAGACRARRAANQKAARSARPARHVPAFPRREAAAGPTTWKRGNVETLWKHWSHSERCVWLSVGADSRGGGANWL